ncbi:hypothetical protein QJQ45_010222 [Haematococcus lacustris]|nr:hypothetical protein QJQ45_010222 [Haematococcus lacustris]
MSTLPVVDGSGQLTSTSLFDPRTPVVAPRKPPQAPRSSQEASQPAASEPGPSTPPPAKRTKAEPAAEPNKAQGKAAKAKPAPQPGSHVPYSPGPVAPPQAPSWGRWLDRETNSCLNLQRIGGSVQRLRELCCWEGLEALPAPGNEYQQGYKLIDDRLPKARQRLHRAAEYRRDI